MLTFGLLSGTDFYLPQDELSEPGTARIAFQFQDANRHDPTFQLSQASWTDPAYLGYFAFFPPSATRDWPAFAQAVRSAFVATPSAQFGWFAGDGGQPVVDGMIGVQGQGTAAPSAQGFALTFRNVSFQFVTGPFGSPATISFDDAGNFFSIINPQVGGTPAARVVVTPPFGSLSTYFSTSATLPLPMTGPNAGSLNAAFQLDTDALAQFEAGMMYFAPGAGGGLITALRYPTFRAPGGAPAPLGMSAWFDVADQLNGRRSYFQLVDPRVGSYFSSAAGGAFALLPQTGATPEETSRLVFANRPATSSSDANNYYLTPAGPFTIAADTALPGPPSAGPETPAGALLCGVTGTEFLQVDAADAQDGFLFVPEQPAYRPTPLAAAARRGDATVNDPVYLDDGGGNVTTSWVQFVTTAGSYVAQPQGSPLYQQANGAALLGGSAAPSGLSVYLLDFLPLATWTPASPSGNGAQSSAPPVPMVPYSGVPFATDQSLDLAEFLEMESTALNPARKHAFTSASQPRMARAPRAGTEAPTFAMTPQGMLAGLEGVPALWSSLQMAVSPAGPFQIQNMGTEIRQAVQQNQIFTVISTTGASDPTPLFDFSLSSLNIGDWVFDLSPDGTKSADGTPPILILKFYPGQSIASLVDDVRMWSEPDVFNPDPFGPTQAQTFLQGLIQQACEAVYGAGNCPDGIPSGTPDTTSLYYNFYQVVTDPAFSGILAVNCTMKLNELPPAIKAVLGGMTDPDVSGFRVHHAGVQINDISPADPQLTMAQSSLFALVDYESAPPTSVAAQAPLEDLQFYHFDVEYLRALFLNSELRDFSCQINLTINDLFGTSVNLTAGNAAPQSLTSVAGAAVSNVIAVSGSYQAHSTTGDDTTSGEGVYSFVAAGNFTFDFKDGDGNPTSPYLETITLTKLQFSFDQETAVTSLHPPGTSSQIASSFGIWGSMVFRDLEVLDIFSFEQLVFADLAIGVSFDLTVFDDGSQPITENVALAFSPGNLRLDLGQTTTKTSPTSLLSLIPFKLKSFLYSQDGQTLESLKYYAFSSIPGLSFVKDTFNYGLVFDLDLGSMGGLVGSLSAFKFSILIGWLDGDEEGIAFGVQLPQVNGKLEIQIEGVLTISIEQFTLLYAGDSSPQMLVLGLQNAYMQVLGTRLPPSGTVSFGLFAPTEGDDKIGWIAAYNEGEDGGGGGEPAEKESPSRALATTNGGGGAEDSAFELVYLGAGQRVGPDPASPPTTFAGFLAFMQGEFWDDIKNQEFDKVYHPDSKWLALTDFKLLGIVEVGFVFYDVTPFYSLVLNVTGYFNFEITYTKVSDSIGLFYANLTLPDTLRTFEVGAASVTLPGVAVSVYTNGNWKVDLGFPAGDDWSGCFQVQAMAGPVPVTGAGGFYLASLSSATDPDVFQGQYASILAFGLAARLGVGKDFTAGPLKAGISVTFFGIIQGAAGYISSGSTDIFSKPDALSLQGQFGIIGELYGSIDFVLVKASVNVVLSASIGVVLKLEPAYGYDGSILLYIEASVSVSVTVTINLFLFSIHISFSFNASFRFQWELAGQAVAHARDRLLARHAGRTLGDVPAPGLCPGLSPALPLWFLPELTVVFADTVDAGVPWFVCSLGVEYDNDPPPDPTYAQFKPFEAVTAQLVTWALSQTIGVTDCSSTVTLADLEALDESPDELVGWIDYETGLLPQLANFQAAITVPSEPPGTVYYRALFPMFPFLELTTTGRLDGSAPADLNYQFLSENIVPSSYLATVDEYFNQLFVNQTSGGDGELAAATATDGTTPLSQEVFLDYFTGLIRGGVHQLLQTMQDAQESESALDALMRAAVGSGGFKSLAGQMSSSFRGGARLPYLDGQTVPGGPADASTNPLYALLWQEFPVGEMGTGQEYAVAITNPDASTYPWVTPTVDYSLTATAVGPYQDLLSNAVSVPSAPVQLPFTNTGPQAFPFENAIVWTQQPQNATLSLRPFPTNLARLLATLQASIAVLVESRQGGAPYLPGGTPLPPGDVTWATMVDLTVSQVPAEDGTTFLPDIYSLSGANQDAQAQIGQILGALEQGIASIASIEILYQASAGASGLTSGDTTTLPADVFVLRTNTTTVSAPPPGFTQRLTANVVPPEVPVAAPIDDHIGFLQILQQACVTNASGYYLRYLDAANQNLPASLFSAGPAPLTVLVTYAAGDVLNDPASPSTVAPYCNAIALAGTDASLLYYAETTDPSLAIQYAAVAAGCVGMELSRSESVMQIQATPAVARAAGVPEQHGHTRSDLIAALVAQGVDDEADLHQLLSDAGAAPAALNALYSLVSYEVQGSTGFIASNLSAPIQPQKPNPDDPVSSYRVFVPLYNVAEANQSLPPGVPPDRYASLGSPFTVGLYLCDAFGNQLPDDVGFSGTNYYFDPIIPVDQWLGVVPTYDFEVGGAPQPHAFTCHLMPSAAAFTQMTDAQAAAALTLYQSIETQVTGAGVSFYLETSLALESDGTTMVKIPLTTAQSSAVADMVSGIVGYLDGTSPVLPGEVALSATATGPGALPPVFEITVLLGIERDINLISPLLKDSFGGVTFPSAQNVSSAVASTTGVTVSIDTVAAQFAQAFPALTLAVSVSGTAQQAQQQSSAAKVGGRLRSLGLAGDGTGSGGTGNQALWAAQRVLLDVSIGASGTSGPRFLSPKPLDNTLNSATVPLPTLASGLPQLPASRLFVDIDLDQFNRQFFQAVDNVLAPASAANAFEVQPSAYQTIATGRESLSEEYAQHEVDWLFSPQSPFTGSPDQLAVAQEVFDQQMRAALMTAYAVDTIVQYDVQWSGAVPPAADNMLELFGQVQPVPPSGDGAASGASDNQGLSTAHVGVVSTGQSTLTFLYGTPDIQDEAEKVFELGLQFNVTHLQYFLAPEGDTPSGEARPSLWLQLVEPYPQGVPPIGPPGTPVVIPLVYRQYPTPPTVLSQSWLPAQSGQSGQSQTGADALTDRAVWTYVFAYQAQLTPHDQVNASVTYNTDLSASGGKSTPMAAAGGPAGPFSLFEALARFNATYAVLQPLLSPLSQDATWAAAIAAFADRVTEVVENTDWNPIPSASLRSGLQLVVDSYVVTDLAETNNRLITLAWTAMQGESSFPGVTLSVEALDPNTLVAYPGQVLTRPAGQPYLTDSYVPQPPLVDDWALHQVEVSLLNVLAAENALAGVGIGRNLIEMVGPDDTTWSSQPEFIYSTPLVRPSQPLTPFIVDATPIDVAELPPRPGGAACPPSPSSLCQRIYTLMSDLLADPDQLAGLMAARWSAGMDEAAPRRVKATCSYQYPMPAATSGAPGADPISPLVPVVLARSFVIDASQPDQIGDFAQIFSEAITAWSTNAGIAFGASALAGAQFVFDITLFAELSGLTTPVLEFTNLQLALSGIDAVVSPAMSER